MVPARIKSKQVAVQHVREPCQRMPEVGMSGRECPYETLTAQTFSDLVILSHIDVVVENNEIMVYRWPKDVKGSQR